MLQLLLIISCIIFPSSTSFTFSFPNRLELKASILSASKDNEDRSTTKIKIKNSNKKNNKRLIDALIEGNPELQHIHMPFIEPLGNNYIDCKMIFGLNVNNIPYIIATPHDSSVAICYTTEADGDKYVFLQPEDDEMKDIFPIANEELSKLCPDLKLKNTPRTLTISGDLKKYTDSAWDLGNKVTSTKQKQQKVNDNNIDDDDLSDSKSNDMDPMIKSLIEELSKENTEEDERYFEETMRKALGDKYVPPGDDVSNDDNDFLDNIDPKLLEIFDSDPDISNLKDDEIKSLLKEMISEENLNPFNNNEEEIDADTSAATSMYALRQEAVAEKLLSFKCDDKIYSLVHKLEPTIILGRDDPLPQFSDSRKLLVTLEEMDYVLPQIEELCAGEFEKYGVLSSSSTSA